MLEEKYGGKGSFKVAILASKAFDVMKPEDRRQFVTLKPKPEEPASTPSLPHHIAVEEEEETEYMGSTVFTLVSLMRMQTNG